MTGRSGRRLLRNVRVLHIAGGFAQNALYAQLASHLDRYLETQFIFAPVRSEIEAALKPENMPGSVEYEIQKILEPWHRVFFNAKVQMIYRAICEVRDPSIFNLTHAHTLYSDGAVAWRLKADFGNPYVVSFRNTDLNVFMRWRPDLGRIGRCVLQEAAQVIFLSPAYQKGLLARLDPSLRSVVERKCTVLPNGVDPFWCEPTVRNPSTTGQLRLLYVGNASKNKNIGTTLRAVALLARDSSVRLTLVGSGRADKRMQRWLKRYTFARHLGRIDNRDELRRIYREHDIFVMPSFRETFGVVYLEALSQGLPIVHSRGQGIEGYFPPGTVSEGVDPGNESSVAEGISAIAARLQDVRGVAMAEASKFSWKLIAQDYARIYADAISPDKSSLGRY